MDATAKLVAVPAALAVSRLTDRARLAAVDAAFHSHARSAREQLQEPEPSRSSPAASSAARAAAERGSSLVDLGSALASVREGLARAEAAERGALAKEREAQERARSAHQALARAAMTGSGARWAAGDADKALAELAEARRGLEEARSARFVAVIRVSSGGAPSQAPVARYPAIGNRGPAKPFHSGPRALAWQRLPVVRRVSSPAITGQ